MAQPTVVFPPGPVRAYRRLTDFFRPPWRRDGLALVGLAGVLGLFFWPIISGQAWLPHGGGDLVSFLYPMYRFAAASWQQGEIPLWNPYQYAGAPVVADNQSGLFYPANLLLMLLWPRFPYAALEGLVVGHFFLAGAGMYLCLRGLYPSRPLRRPAAWLGGLSFMLSGLFVTHIGNLNLIAVAAWLPLIFLCFHRSLAAGRWPRRLGWLGLGGLGFGISTLAGHGQMSFLAAVLVGSYGLFQAARRLSYPAEQSKGGRLLASLGPLVFLLGLGLVGLLVAAIGLWPAAGGLDQTLRAGFNYQAAINYSLPRRALVGLLAPDYFGRGVLRFWGDWPRVEYGYAGVLPWCLAAVALAGRRRRLTWFWALGGLLFLALALGGEGPVYPLFLQRLPVIPFQAPARFVLLLDFCLAALAAAGADEILAGGPGQPERRRLSLLLLGAGLAALIGLAGLTGRLLPVYPERTGQMIRALAVLGALAAASGWLVAARWRNWLSPGPWTALAALLLVVDLVGLGRHVEVEWNDPTAGFPQKSPALDYLLADPGLHRVDIATGAWQPGTPQLYGLYGSGGVFNPLQLANYTVFAGAVGYRGSPLYNLLGIKYVVGQKEEPPGDTTFIPPVFDADPAVTIYLNTRALPRVQLVYDIRTVANDEAAFAAIHQPDFDPGRQAVITAPPGIPALDRLDQLDRLDRPPTGAGRLEVLQYGLNQVAFTTVTAQPAYLVLSDTFHPHWRATLDGAPAPLLVANYAFRAVYVPAGEHVVAMHYRPAGWVAGMMVTGLSLLLSIGGGMFWWSWERRTVRGAAGAGPERGAL